jgi:hypothetical protein
VYKVTSDSCDLNAVVRPTASNEMINIVKNGDKVRIWKKSSVAHLKLLHQHSFGNSETQLTNFQPFTVGVTKMIRF